MSQTQIQTRTNIRPLIFSALFTALIIVGAFLKLPTPTVAITFQFAFTCLTGLLLGQKWGTIAAALYMLLGLIGLPVFTGGGGPGYVLAPSFGFIVGFVLGIWVSGFLLKTERPIGFWRFLAAATVNWAIVYFCGMLHFWLIRHLIGGATMTLRALFSALFVFFGPKDYLLAILCSLIAVRLQPVLKAYLEK